MKHFITTTLFLLIAIGIRAQAIIQLENENGRDMLQADINGVTVKAYYTDEPWNISLSSTTYLFLNENGYIPDSDVQGMSSVKMTNGTTVKAGAFVIKNLKIGNVTLKNVPATVIAKQTVPLLIGSQAFQDFGEIVKEDGRLSIGLGSNSPAQVDTMDILRTKLQDCLSEKNYAEAETIFKQLYSAGELNMFTQYQYCMVLGLNGNDKDNSIVSTDWIGKYAGKSLSMDYWIYDGLGNSLKNLGDNMGAISSYLKAKTADFDLYNTDEKAIKKGEFKNEDLGKTLFALGQAYARADNISRGEYWCILSAKCGYQPAIDFCKKYKLNLK